MEGRNVAVVWSQTIVHGEQSDRCKSRQNPESVHEIEFDWSNLSNPESNNDHQDEQIIADKNQAKEGNVSKVCSVAVEIDKEQEEHETQDAAECQRNDWAFCFRLRREVIRDCFVKLIVFSHSKI